MNTLRALVLAFAVIATGAQAKIPEPDAIYYGKVRHNGGDEVVPQNGGDIVVSARLNGVTLAQTTLGAMSSAFVLKVPLDDGQEPRLTGMARGGERIRVYVRSVSLNVEYEANQSATPGLNISSVRGNLQPTDLTVEDDLGGMSQAFAAFGLWMSGQGLSPTSGGQDSDNDGLTNLQEFSAGTDPNNSNDRFRILEIRRTNGVTSIRFGPIRMSRVYSLYCSPDLSSSNWLKISEVIPNVNADSMWRDHVLGTGTDHLFYKLDVDIQ